MKAIIVVGARPNFMKAAPLIRAIDGHNNGHKTPKIEYLLVHTGQHYDYKMSRVFFQDLQLPEPDIHLGVGSGTHAEQTGNIMIEFEKVLFQEKPDLVIVMGDVNSTLAAALAAVKVHIPIAHIEAGLRLCDMTIPEEVNRLLTDAVADYLFTPFRNADEKLKNEGITPERIFFVGNIMVDNLLSHREAASQRQILSRLGVSKGGYAALTLHRPANVDNKKILSRIVSTVKRISEKIPVICPVHPRTQRSIRQFGLEDEFGRLDINQSAPVITGGLYLTEPLSYLDFLSLEMNAKFVMTDSGGIQAETTILDIPCLTLMDGNVWPPTVSEGTNTLVGNEPGRIIDEAYRILDGNGKRGTCPELWDGKAAERIVKVLVAGRPGSA
jgi:UDP-N-acetylglucosamine 2-epimerase (non-hydrolysing)